MFTRKVLSSIKNPELRRALHLDDSDPIPESDVTWIRDGMDKLLDKVEKVDIVNCRDDVLQQSDLLRQFYLSIAMCSLQFAYDNANEIVKPGDLPVPPHKNVQDNSDKHVIVVGAGLSGMVAAYEPGEGGLHGHHP